jgi:hypothetical protein
MKTEISMEAARKKRWHTHSEGRKLAENRDSQQINRFT